MTTYPEQRFRHRQDGTCHKGEHPNWGPSPLGSSDETMKKSGCMTVCFAYLYSRLTGQEHAPGDLNTYLNAKGGYTYEGAIPGGLMLWDKASAWARGLLVLSTRFDKTYTIRAVIVGHTRHWVVELRGGYAFDPLSGDVVSLSEKFKTGRWQDSSIRRYVKAIRKPAT